MTSHLSVELGRLRAEEFAGGRGRIHRHFRTLAPWVRAARGIHAERFGLPEPRISTCLLLDDHLTGLNSPSAVVPVLVEAAQEAGLMIDYLARESSCVVVDDVPVASLVVDRIVPDPPPGTTGSRPPVVRTGWLSNGERAPGGNPIEAMGAPTWVPPAEYAAHDHSVFVEVELWADHGERRTWSYPFLAAVWQLLRLGVLRSMGRPVAAPRPLTGRLPDTWAELPPIVQLNAAAGPFSAYRTLSILPTGLLRAAQAVRTILSQVHVDGAAAVAVAGPGEGLDLPTEGLDLPGEGLDLPGEGLDLPTELVDRLEYVFIG